jgi:DNA-binding winged helix-turn-helix (wHTH) protein
MQGNSKEIQSAYRFGVFELHPSERQLYRKGKRVALPPKAFDALLRLVTNAERLVRKDELMRALWPDTFVEEANLTNTVVTLRKVLGKTAIETVSKFGYRFTLPVTGEPGVDARVYATFVRAKQTFAARADAVRAARDLFLLCVTQDPEFAPAWAWLGRCYRFLHKFGVDPALNLELARAAFDRALAIDAHLAAAHQFLTNFQADTGQARDAMVRLRRRIAERGGEAESYAGLVQTLRFCGLLRESIAAHERAMALDPGIATGVAHTYFLLGDYNATLAHYPPGARIYLDVAAMAALGSTEQAKAKARERLEPGAAGRFTVLLLSTLLAAIEQRRDEVLRTIDATPITHEPEALFYLARHCSMVSAANEAIGLIQRARTEGFVSSHALQYQSGFERIRDDAAFRSEIDQAIALEDEARRAYTAAAG